MPGLPFSPLPAAQNAESIFQQQFEEQKRQLQEQFNLGWNTIRQRAGTTLRPVQANEMLAEFHAKGQMAALELKQKYQLQMDAFKRIDAMVSQGLLTNGEEAKLDMVLDPETRKYQPKTQDVETRFKNLESMEDILEQDLSPFKLEPGVATGGHRHWYAPLAERGKIPTGEAKLKVTDPAEYVWDDDLGRSVKRTGVSRGATDEEIDRYEVTMATLDQIRAKKTALLSQMMDSASSMQKAGLRKMGGAFDQKITASMQGRLTPGEVAEGWTGYGPSFRQPTTTAPQTTPTGNIRVRSPDGKIGSIPVEDWEEAKRNGFVRVQ